MREQDETVRLVARAQQGDVAAFACLVERHGVTLRRFCARLAGVDGSAEDLAQETLLRAFRALPGLGAPERFEAWLLAIAANLARTWWRRQARWPLSLEALELAYPDVPWEGLRSPVWAPDRIVEEAEQREILRRALEALPSAMGRAVALHYLDGLDYQEIATALDVPVSTVRGRLFTSRRRLRAELLAAGWPARAARAAPANHTKRTEKGVPMDGELEEVAVDSIRTKVTALGGMAPNRVVMLKAKQRERYLPIVIGVPEADAIAMRLQGKESPRPLTHDLMLNGFAGLGARVSRVVVSDWQEETFYGRLHLERDGAETVLDARPSDCIALAVRTGTPIYAAGTVMERCGVEPLAPAGQPGGEFQPTERAQKVLFLTRLEMARFGRDELTSDLLLLGILAEGQSITARVLEEAGVPVAQARAAVAALSGFGDRQPPENRLPEPANSAFRTLAEDAARVLGNRFIGTEHLLLAILAEEEGPAGQVLTHLGVGTSALRERLIDAVRAQAQLMPPRN
jgi:RNA polymerase sigma factor (sigma-70 family)